MLAGAGALGATDEGAPPVDACTGATTSIRLDEPEPTPELEPVEGSTPAWGNEDPGWLVEPDAVTGTEALASLPFASGLELRPTTTAAGAWAESVDEPSATVPLAGARTVTSGRRDGEVPVVELPEPAVPVDPVPWPAVVVAGTVADVDVDEPELPVDDPCVLALTGALTQMRGPTQWS